MARVLALEPDPARGAILARMVKTSLNVEAVVVRSADDAIDALYASKPDVILISTLLPPLEDERLSAHLRLAPDLDHLPVLTVPPLLELPVDNSRGLLARLFRRRQIVSPMYDFGAVAERIKEALAQSKLDARHHDERQARLLLLDGQRARLLGADNSGAAQHLRLVRLDDTYDQLDLGDGSHAARARRWNPHELPWLDAVKLSWGGNVRVRNLSASGLLVESGFRFTLGNRTEFNIVGPSYDLIVEARVVRTSLADGGDDGSRHLVAAVFEQPFDLLTPVGLQRELQNLGLVRRIA